MKHIRYMVLGVAALGMNFSGAPPFGAAFADVMPETTEPLGEPKAGSGFNAEQLRRLGELRAWMLRRRGEREQGLPLSPLPRDPQRGRAMTVYSDRQLLTPLGQRYAIGFQSRRNEPAPPQGSPVLHIGRGPDGRIHHRYVFNEAEQDEVEPTIPSPSYSGATQSRHYSSPPLPKGSGTIQAGQRIVRIWTPTTEPVDQRAAPRLEYELPDQRR